MDNELSWALKNAIRDHCNQYVLTKTCTRAVREPGLDFEKEMISEWNPEGWQRAIQTHEIKYGAKEEKGTGLQL